VKYGCRRYGAAGAAVKKEIVTVTVAAAGVARWADSCPIWSTWYGRGRSTPVRSSTEGYRAMDERRAVKRLLRPW